MEAPCPIGRGGKLSARLPGGPIVLIAVRRADAGPAHGQILCIRAESARGHFTSSVLWWVFRDVVDVVVVLIFRISDRSVEYEGVVVTDGFQIDPCLGSTLNAHLKSRYMCH